MAVALLSSSSISSTGGSVLLLWCRLVPGPSSAPGRDEGTVLVAAGSGGGSTSEGSPHCSHEWELFATACCSQAGPLIAYSLLWLICPIGDALPTGSSAPAPPICRTYIWSHTTLQLSGAPGVSQLKHFLSGVPWRPNSSTCSVVSPGAHPFLVSLQLPTLFPSSWWPRYGHSNSWSWKSPTQAEGGNLDPDLNSAFVTYAAILAEAFPARTKDLMAYSRLIVRKASSGNGKGWLSYDRMFRQNAAANLSLSWANLDPSLHSSFCLGSEPPPMACSLCNELDHRVDDCALFRNSYSVATPSSPSSQGFVWLETCPQESQRAPGSACRGTVAIACCQARASSHMNATPATRITWQRIVPSPQQTQCLGGLSDPRALSPQLRALAHTAGDAWLYLLMYINLFFHLWFSLPHCDYNWWFA